MVSAARRGLWVASAAPAELSWLWCAGAGELAHAFEHERELAGAGASCAGPQLGARAGGVVGAVVAVVDHDAVCVAFVGACERCALGVGVVGVLRQRHAGAVLIDAPGAALIGNDVQFG